MEGRPSQNICYLEALSAEEQERIFGTGAWLTEQIGALLLNQQIIAVGGKAYTVLQRFEELAEQCQAIYSEANADTATGRSQSFLHGIRMGAGTAWRALVPFSISLDATPAVLENCTICLDQQMDSDDNSPEEKYIAMQEIMQFCDELLAEHPRLDLKLQPPATLPVSMDDETLRWFKRGAAVGYTYVLDIYKDVLEDGAANDLNLMHIVRIAEEAPAADTNEALLDKEAIDQTFAALIKNAYPE